MQRCAWLVITELHKVKKDPLGSSSQCIVGLSVTVNARLCRSRIVKAYKYCDYSDRKFEHSLERYNVEIRKILSRSKLQRIDIRRSVAINVIDRTEVITCALINEFTTGIGIFEDDHNRYVKYTN